MTETTTQFVLQDEEVLVIRRFNLLLNDNGYAALLMLAAAEKYFELTDSTTKLISAAVIDILNATGGHDDETDRHDDIYLAAPALKLIVDLANEVKIPMPPASDCAFIPSDELVQKCLIAYFMHLDANAVGQSMLE